MTSTLVIGLDGANWGLIEGWLADGRLPNIARLGNEGVHAVSESERLPVTCPSWKCYATSNNPGELGVFWWEQIDMERHSVQLADEGDIDTSQDVIERDDYVSYRLEDRGYL